MFQNKDGNLPESDAVAPEERAYEDNWYRSLKALADQRQGDDGPEDAEAAANDRVDVAPGEPDTRSEEPARPEDGPADAPAPAADRERLVSQEFETRAGQLLERLRSIQQLSER